MVQGTRVLEFRAALPLCHNPLRHLKLLGAELVERDGPIPNLVDESRKYRSQVVEIERERRQELQENQNEILPGMRKAWEYQVHCEERIDELEECILSARARARERLKMPDVKNELKAWRTKLYAARKAVKAISKEYSGYSLLGAVESKLAKNSRLKKVTDESQEKRQKLLKQQAELLAVVAKYSAKQTLISKRLAKANLHEERRTLKAIREIYKPSPLYWGVKNDIKAGVEASRKKAPPVHRRSDGEISLYAQIPDGKTWDQLFAQRSAQAVIRRIPRDQVLRKSKNGHTIYNGKHSYNHYYLKLRIGEDASTGWVEIPFILRPDRWPKDGLVVGIRLRRRRFLHRFQWLVQFVVKSSTFARETGDGTVGLNFGWRGTREGMRTVRFVDLDGEDGELCLSHENFLDRWDHARDLQSEMNTNFDVMHERLGEWLKTQTTKPAWFPDMRGFSKWKTKKLALFVGDCEKNNFHQKLRLFQDLTAWRRLNRKLFDEYRIINGRTDNRRRYEYLKFVAELRKKYHTVYIPELDLTKFARKKKVEDDGEAQELRFRQKKACISSLKQALAVSGMKVIERKMEFVTQICHQCGHLNDYDAARQLDVCCEGCGAEYDQDLNAALNVLYGGPRKQLCAAKKPAAARKRVAATT